MMGLLVLIIEISTFLYASQNFTLKSCNNGLAMLMWLEFPIISQNAF